MCRPARLRYLSRNRGQENLNGVFSAIGSSAKSRIRPNLTWSGVLAKTSGVIAQNVVFVEQETP
jgi:hypothetical protein